MARIIWSPDAANDLEQIVKYIAIDSKRYARIVAKEIIKITRSISQFPNAGRMVPEYNNFIIRERIYKSYRIIYKIDEGVIIIANIFHSARSLTLLE